MVHFVGAGSGAVDLITVRGAKLLSEADVVIYAGSLVNPEHLNRCKADCEIHDSADVKNKYFENIFDMKCEGGHELLRYDHLLYVLCHLIKHLSYRGALHSVQKARKALRPPL